MNPSFGRRRFLKLAGIGAGSMGAAVALAKPGTLFNNSTASSGQHSSVLAQGETP